ncbi:MAG: ribosome recycling factor [Candidatus Binatia bacterium]
MATTDDVVADLRKEMEGTIVAMRREMSRTRTGRASTALLEGITVEYYGAKTPLNQLATLSAPEPRLLVIQPFDRSAINEIERAIMQSDLGLMPQNDGKLVRVPIPELTEERRRDLVKHIRKVAEEFRVSLRSHRRDANDLLKEIEKDGDITQDDLHRGQEKTQELTKDYTERLDKVLKAKEEEIMEV